MGWIKNVLWLITIAGFFASSYFLGWLSNVNFIISEINVEFWAKLPWEFQVMITGFIVVIIVSVYRVIIRD